MNNNKHNGHVINEMTPEQVASWLGTEVRFKIICDAPNVGWHEVVETYGLLTGQDNLNLTKTLKYKAPCYLLVANDEYIDVAIEALDDGSRCGEEDCPAVLINDESGYGAIFSCFHAENRRTLLGVFGDLDEAQYLIDAWNGDL